MNDEIISADTIDAFLHLLKKGEVTFRFEEEAHELFVQSNSDLDNPNTGIRQALNGKKLEEWAVNFQKVLSSGAKAGRLRDPELFTLRVYPIERVHDERFIDGSYDSRLNTINQKLDNIRKEYGLESDEFWLIGDGPAEWEVANREFETIMKDLLCETFAEFGNQDLAELLQNNPNEFNRLREIGRMAVFQPSDTLTNTLLDEIRKQFFKESELCAQAEAYYAACVMLGATIEAAMLALCHKNKEKALLVATSKLPSKIRPKTGSEPATWTFAQLVHVADAAGWLPNFQIADMGLSSKGLINLTRELRNSVHPGRYIDNKLRIKIAEQDYKDAKAIYQIVKNYVILPMLEVK
jgi:hypothetical protein